MGFNSGFKGLMLSGVINFLYCGNHTEHVSSLFGNEPGLFLKLKHAFDTVSAVI